MLLALQPLSTGWQTVCYAIAFVLLALGGIGFKPAGERLRLESLGLAAFVFPFLWNAWAAY
jgi:hypothetical protein